MSMTYNDFEASFLARDTCVLSSLSYAGGPEDAACGSLDDTPEEVRGVSLEDVCSQKPAAQEGQTRNSRRNPKFPGRKATAYLTQADQQLGNRFPSVSFVKSLPSDALELPEGMDDIMHVRLHRDLAYVYGSAKYNLTRFYIHRDNCRRNLACFIAKELQPFRLSRRQLRQRADSDDPLAKIFWRLVPRKAQRSDKAFQEFFSHFNLYLIPQSHLCLQ